jgi:predicted dehydrogenase
LCNYNKKELIGMKYVKEKARLGVIGLGQRGHEELSMMLDMPEVEIKCVCDTIDFRVKKALDLTKEKSVQGVEGYSDYKKLLERDDLDGVAIFTSWNTHTKIAVDAMKAGLYAAMEVGGAASVEECWSLVRAYEETGMPCMMLENANYSKQNLALLRMVKEELFGELIYCTGGYQHDLRDEIGLGREIKHYRHLNFMNRNGELYPTHEIGPIAKLLNINRGNRFMTLSSVASKAVGLGEYYKNSRKAYNSWVKEGLEEYDGELPENIKDYDLIGKNAACGDIVTTLIKCSGGETICIVHDCTLPRPRLANFRVQGTNGIWMGDAHSIYIEGVSPVFDKWENDEQYFEKYNHPLWKEYSEDPGSGSHGHGGIDFLVVKAFVDALRQQTQTPIDVYDAASWMAITCLSEHSVALGGTPVAFPDFTNGAWLNRRPSSASKYSLDKICWECFE